MTKNNSVNSNLGRLFRS